MKKPQGRENKLFYEGRWLENKNKWKKKGAYNEP